MKDHPSHVTASSCQKGWSQERRTTVFITSLLGKTVHTEFSSYLPHYLILTSLAKRLFQEFHNFLLVSSHLIKLIMELSIGNIQFITLSLVSVNVSKL